MASRQEASSARRESEGEGAPAAPGLAASPRRLSQAPWESHRLLRNAATCTFGVGGRRWLFCWPAVACWVTCLRRSYPESLGFIARAVDLLGGCPAAPHHRRGQPVNPTASLRRTVCAPLPDFRLNFRGSHDPYPLICVGRCLEYAWSLDGALLLPAQPPRPPTCSRVLRR